MAIMINEPIWILKILEVLEKIKNENQAHEIGLSGESLEVIKHD